jgi:single-stranded DNA-binding protein
MDLNIVVLAGHLATLPEIRQFTSGTRMARFLVTVRSTEPRRRVDVVPVTLWDPPPTLLSDPFVVGRQVWVAGSVQRRFWSETEGRRSRIEIIAHTVELRGTEDADGKEERAAG